jgi:hypothetical protein
MSQVDPTTDIATRLTKSRNQLRKLAGEFHLTIPRSNASSVAMAFPYFLLISPVRAARNYLKCNLLLAFAISSSFERASSTYAGLRVI